jgi:hypothetical protein
VSKHKGESLEKRREELMAAAMRQAQLAETLKLYEAAAARMPAPVLVNTGVVRYATGGNA